MRPPKQPQRRLRLRSVVVATVLGLIGGCATVRASPPKPVPRSPQTTASAAWQVGAAEIDITPVPGYPTAGHSREATVALGVWTRLRAQVIYIEDARGTPLVLVVCDLWAIEPGLVDRIAQRLRDHPGLDHVGRPHLIVAATHTHHGPGLFSTSKIYSAFAASEGGHDPDLFDTLTLKLASAIAEAAAARRPARIERRTVAVPTLARNRSVAALMANPEAADLLRSNAALPGCLGAPSAGEVDPCHAIDPRLDAIEFRDADTDQPIAVAGVFAMHPTGMPRQTELFHADVFGIASTRAQAKLRERAGPGSHPVVALFNGAEGDVSPNWNPQGRTSTVDLGHMLGDALVASLGVAGLPVEGTIELGFGWRPIAHQRFDDAHGQPQRTARAARSGKAQFGGAEDGRTALYERGWREGKRRTRARRNGHGNKPLVAPWPVGALAPPPGFTPRDVPLTVARLGDLALVTLPGEVSTVLGHRITARINARVPALARVVPLGLAGGYLSYFTTPEEYAEQHYEGASMLYGEQAGVLLGEHLAALARDPTIEPDPPRPYRVGRIRRWSFDRDEQAAAKTIAERLPLQLDTDTLVNLPHLYLWDDAPRWPSHDPHANVTIRPRIETYTPGRGWHTLVTDDVPVDDHSGDLATAVTHVDQGQWRWGVWWLAPRAGHQQPLRVRVETVGGTPRCSEVFTIKRWLTPQRSRWLTVGDCTTALP